MNYSQHNQQLLDTATQVQEVLSRHGLSSGIAGGFARDAFYGLDAKDIDVWVYGLDLAQEDVYNHLRWAIKQLQYLYPEHELLCEDESYEGHSDNRQIYAVLKLSAGVDVIFVEDSHDLEFFRQDTLKSVVDRFDYNINQFIISDGIPVYEGLYHPADDGLVKLRDDTPPERIEKMEQRWARILEVGA